MFAAKYCDTTSSMECVQLLLDSGSKTTYGTINYKDLLPDIYKKNQLYISKKCCVCIDDSNSQMISLKPCGHTNICISCFFKLQKKECPTCKQTYDNDDYIIANLI